MGCVGVLKGIRLFLDYFSNKEAVLREFAVGMNSEVDIQKDLHILFLDYDLVSEEEVAESVSEVQAFYNLSDCFIYKTHNGFHAYFFYDQMPYSRVRQIIDFAKYVDPMFRFISRYYDYKTIRVVGKYKVRDIVFVKVLKGRRNPSLKEAERGDMKRKEREYLSGLQDVLKKDNLKVN